MTTIAQFSKPEEAHLLRMRLAEAGIESFIRDEYFVQLDWLLSNAVGGVRVDVHDEAVDDANELFQADAGEPPDPDAVRCPECGCSDVAQESFSRKIAYLFVALLNLPILILRHRWRCNRCLHTWKHQPKAPR